jgi:hypothetical protein
MIANFKKDYIPKATNPFFTERAVCLWYALDSAVHFVGDTPVRRSAGLTPHPALASLQVVFNRLLAGNLSDAETRTVAADARALLNALSVAVAQAGGTGGQIPALADTANYGDEMLLGTLGPLATGLAAQEKSFAASVAEHGGIFRLPPTT